jgi:hypothetical protein
MKIIFENALIATTGKLSRLTIITALPIMLLLLLTPTFAAHARPTPTLLTSMPLAGTVPAGTFTGTGTVNSLAMNNGMLTVNGLLNGVIHLVNGTALPLVNALFSATGNLTRSAATGACQLLHLALGPINLNLLGLVLTTSPITIDLTAASGPGNLLGNLLCSVAHLLDNNGPLTAVQALLNRINAILSGV